MKCKQKTALMFIIIAFAIVCSAITFEVFQVVLMPNEYRVVKEEGIITNVNLPFGLLTTGDEENVLKCEKAEATTERTGISGGNLFWIRTTAVNNATIEFRLFGLLPIKKMIISIVPPVNVMPGGQSIGVKLYTQGVLVVALADFIAIDGKACNPAAEAEIFVGDSIVSINSVKVRDADHVIELLSKCDGKVVALDIKRSGKIIKKNIEPKKSQEDGKYKIGAWVRDKTAGVGTLSFYLPESREFGALGHAITDVDTGLMLSVEEGEILESKIASIQKGERSRPGEIRGIFFEEQKRLGIIKKNTEFGIFGTLNGPLKNECYGEPIPIASRHQVKEGSAYILTTVDKKVRRYSVEVQKVANQHAPGPKSMIIKVTDLDLLKATGGIVQGMSGSPIVQQDRLIGIITHVFINDPTKGYAIFAEWMVEKALK